jgi:hypothetical protein
VEPLESATEAFSNTVQHLIEPFVKLQKEGLDKVARIKAQDLLDDPRLATILETA